MTHKINGKNPEDTGPQTGDEWIDLGKRRGAVVREGGRFTSIETPKGKVIIAPGDERLDKMTRSNLKRWFRLLGLMIVILVPIINLIKHLF